MTVPILMFRTVLTGYAVLFSVSSTAQGTTGLTTPVRSALPNNGFSVQLAGNAPIISLNYHRILLRFRPQSDQTDHGSVEVGLGVGYTPVFQESGLVNLPHYMSVNYGSRRFRGEIGYGGTDGRRGALFGRGGYQPGLITGIRLVPTPQVSIRLFAWTTFYRDAYYVQDPQLQVFLRETQLFRVFPGLSFIRYIN